MALINPIMQGDLHEISRRGLVHLIDIGWHVHWFYAKAHRIQKRKKIKKMGFLVSHKDKCGKIWVQQEFQEK